MELHILVHPWLQTHQSPENNKYLLSSAVIATSQISTVPFIFRLSLISLSNIQNFHW
jgi:hypothetical protein